MGDTPGMRRSPLSSAFDGCYEASRAAALSGVPKTTVYWWARQGIVVPSVSPVQEKLWSYADLMALRIVSWLRHPKAGSGGQPLPASPMPKVRRALALLDGLGLDLWEPCDSSPAPVMVDRAGQIFVRCPEGMVDLNCHPVLLPEDSLALTAPFSLGSSRGPDLLRPRPHLRIVPSKVAGEPHLVSTRITSQAVAALERRGWPIARIASVYEVSERPIREAIDLENQLAGAAAAA